MHTSTQLAVKTAQIRHRHTAAGYKQDQYDLALDALLRHPNHDGDPEQLLANALANARKHLRRRRSIAAAFAVGEKVDLAYLADTSYVDYEPLLWEALDWIDHAPFTRGERNALRNAANAAFGRTHLADDARSRQRLARARASARRARTVYPW